MDSEKYPLSTQKIMTGAGALTRTADEIVGRRKNVLDRVLPGPLQKLVSESELELAKVELQSRQKIFVTIKNAQSQALQEILNQYLIKGKGNLRKERSEFFASEAQSLEHEINKITDAFVVELEQRYARMEKITVPFLKEKEQKRLEASAERYMNAVERLMEDFHNILYEDVAP